MGKRTGICAQDVAIAVEKSCNKFAATLGIHRDDGLATPACSKSQSVTHGKLG